MKRWHQDYKVSYREWKKHRKSHVESNKNNSNMRIGKSAFVIECECDEQVGRFRKKDAWDCGNTRCFICHSDKYPKRSKHEHEIISDFSYKEQLKEL